MYENLTKQELQKKLDEKKWIQSEIGKVDLSGKMEYCNTCIFCYQNFKICPLDQKTRVERSACANAYRDLQTIKELKEGGKKHV